VKIGTGVQSERRLVKAPHRLPEVGGASPQHSREVPLPENPTTGGSLSLQRVAAGATHLFGYGRLAPVSAGRIVGARLIERDELRSEFNRAIAMSISPQYFRTFVIVALCVLIAFVAFPGRLLNLVMVFCFGGLGMMMGLLFLWAVCQSRPDADLTSFGRAFRFVSVVCGWMAVSYFVVVKGLGDLVGGTTNSGEAGMSANGTYYLYAWWRADKHVPVAPEKYWTLYWCEHHVFHVVFATPFLLFGLMLLLQWLVGERVFSTGPADRGRNGQAP
jgi:hypothetical protein